MSIEDKLLGAPAAGGITPSENYNTVLYTGNGGTNAITGVGFKPDLIWIKCRDEAESPKITNSTIGGAYYLYTNQAQVEQNYATNITSFDTDGFTLGSEGNSNRTGALFVAWCWKLNGGTTSTNEDGSQDSTVQVNAAAGMSVISYTGTGADATFGHGLGEIPDWFMIKGRGTSNDWAVITSEMDSGNFLQLNDTAGGSGAGSIFGSSFTYPTSSVFSVGNTGESGTVGEDYLAFAFKSISGFSQFGNYTGNGSTNGPIVETGFEVGWLMIKGYNDSGEWWMVDSKRGSTQLLQAQSDAIESTSDPLCTFLANGFQITRADNNMNQSGYVFNYFAFAVDPDTEVPELASSFNAIAYSGNSSTNTITGYGFEPGLSVLKKRSGTDDWAWFDTIRGSNFMSSNTTSAQAAFTTWTPNADGFTVLSSGMVNATGSTYISYGWKANDDVPTILGGPAFAVYKFEDNANDVTGSFNGTANSITYAAGKFNKAAVFNGTTGDIDLPSTIESTTMSVSLWVYLDNNAPTNEVLIEFDNGYGLNFPSAASGKLAAQWANSNANHTLSNAALSDSQWYHVVANFRSGATDLYIDGVKQTTGGTAADYLTADENTIGSRRSGEFLDGMVDQTRMFQYALTQTQVTELYNETTADNDNVSYGAKPNTIVSVNANAGFSIVEFTTPVSPSANTRVPHGLSAAPDFIIVKRTDGIEDWYVYHTSMGLSQTVRLNSNIAEAFASSLWNTVNATVFNPTFTGTGNMECIAYCFHSVTGYSSFGGYTGTGSAQTITTGFAPDYVITKCTNHTDNWRSYDSVRQASQPFDEVLYPNLGDGEDNNATGITGTTASGFVLGTGNLSNDSGDTYIYMAFKIN